MFGNVLAVRLCVCLALFINGRKVTDEGEKERGRPRKNDQLDSEMSQPARPALSLNTSCDSRLRQHAEHQLRPLCDFGSDILCWRVCVRCACVCVGLCVCAVRNACVGCVDCIACVERLAFVVCVTVLCTSRVSYIVVRVVKGVCVCACVVCVVCVGWACVETVVFVCVRALRVCASCVSCV